MKGLWGRILKVDLTNGVFEDVEPAENLYREYLGGSGLAAKWFFDNKGWTHDPLSPENSLMIMMGPLAGTNLPGSSRLEICARSPLTGIWGESSLGGHFAPQLKATGYDGVIITGASDKPVVLILSDEGQEIRDAEHLWGHDTYDTEEELKKEIGDRAQIICIGPAGENLVKYASIMNDRGSAAGRCGMGAVMGSKKLKAVVVRGKKKTKVADQDGIKEIREKMNETIKYSLVAEGLSAFGSNCHMEYGMAIGDVPVKNWREAYWAAGPGKLGGTTVAETILTKSHSCHGCPVACKRIVKIDAGPFAMQEGPGSEYEAAAALGTLQRIDDLEANHKANELCNKYGLDVISTGGTIAYAIEAFKHGFITDGETGGMTLEWGQPDTLLQLIVKIARREGIGDILAEGSRSVSRKYGGEEFAIQVKGLECPMHDPRALWSMALTYATSIRGACHCSDANMYADMGILSHKDLGIKRSWPYKAKGKAAQTIGSQTKGILANSAVICEYVWTIVGGIAEIRAMVNAATGFGYSVEELVTVADRIWYLKRALGNLCGATRDDDKVPRRILEPHPEDVTSNLTSVMYPTYMTMGPAGKMMAKLGSATVINLTKKFADSVLFPNIDKAMRASRFLPGLWGHHRALRAGNEQEIAQRTVPFEAMLEEYYGLRDIDEQGRPSRSRLEAVGLRDVADQLHGD